MNVVILAAGLGTRLGRPHPKPLTKLADGRTILRQQIDHLHRAFGADLHLTVVVGFKLEMILEAAGGEASFVYNEIFDQTNTSKSLLRALRLVPPGGVLWLNGDVVFVPGLIQALTFDGSFVAVNTARVGEEEVKYTVDGDGYVKELSKHVDDGLGEAVGINYVSSVDRPRLVHYLEQCEDSDYFERGIELAIGEEGLRFSALDITPFGCVEVDFLPDLERANLLTM
ncbi:phosphocholine cytidylyltransferase family protein [Catelliglobosispora koreensis]|uniref:phosphocholine cytidylyltransferase family protein n=1 Tax=Catelliglobosispora koreensis TaxID=129052 RepID=UPI00036F6AD4|nr:phosphocholine cytidylyltransferase family protein [Catelliglobosispora koreensis]